MPYLKTVNLHRGQQLVEFDYPIQYVYFLETAVTSTIVRTPHGETLEVGIMGAEGMTWTSVCVVGSSCFITGCGRTSFTCGGSKNNHR